MTPDVAGRLLDQVIAADVPAYKVAPAAGPVTVTVGSSSPKLSLVPVAGTAPLAVMRRRASAAPGPETDPTKCPSIFGQEAAIVWNVAPPSRLSSTRTVEAPPIPGIQSAISDVV